MQVILHPTLPAGVADLTDAYEQPLGSHDDGSPWVTLCMVSSIDGTTVVSGLSSALSSDTDGALLGHLRTHADVIAVGAGTARAEGYGPPRTKGQRIAVFTRSGNVDVSTPLFTSGAGIVVTTDQATGDFGDVDVIRAGGDEVDLAAAFRRLSERCQRLVTGRTGLVVQVEGGPALNGAIFEADLIDEINLTTSSQVAGGSGPRLTTGAGDLASRFQLRQAALDEESFLYTRWQRT